jgi:hypothetical protein
VLSQIVVGRLVRLASSARGRRSIEEKAQHSQYLAPSEDALVYFLLQLSHPGQPMRIESIRFLAFCVTR